MKKYKYSRTTIARKLPKAFDSCDFVFIDFIIEMLLEPADSSKKGNAFLLDYAIQKLEANLCIKEEDKK